MTEEELFNSATSDEPVTAPVEEQSQERPRDEQGRFAPKAQQEEPEPQPEPKPEPQAQEQVREDANVPSWRLREEREAREAAERRAQERDAYWQRQMSELQAKLPKQEAPPPQDPFENPQGFLDHGVKQAVDPIKNEIGQLREFYSRRDAEREHGPERVKAAYDWIAQGMAGRDPDAVATYQRAMQSMHPFGDIVAAHQQRTVYQQIGNDPNAWFDKTFDQRLADPKFAATVLQKIQQSTKANPQNPLVQIPPSLNRATSAAPPAEDDDDGEAGLLRSALRR